MFDKIAQKISEKFLPMIVAGHKLHGKSMLVNTTAVLMASGRYTRDKAYEMAKEIIKLTESE